VGREDGGERLSYVRVRDRSTAGSSAMLDVTTVTPLLDLLKTADLKLGPPPPSHPLLLDGLLSEELLVGPPELLPGLGIKVVHLRVLEARGAVFADVELGPSPPSHPLLLDDLLTEGLLVGLSELLPDLGMRVVQLRV